MKKHLYSHITAIILILFCLSSYVQSQKVQLQFAVDHAQFRSDNNKVYLEVYYSIKRNSLTYKNDKNGFNAHAIIKTTLSQNNKIIAEDSLVINDFVKTMDEVSHTHRFTEISYINIQEGAYLLSSKLIDNNSHKTIIYKDSLNLHLYPSTDLSLSEIEFATIIKSSNENSKFNKNGLYIVPNTDCMYGSGMTELKFYTEAYNLSCEGNSVGTTYQIHYSIIDANGNSIMEVPGQRKIKPGKSTVIYGSLPIDDLTNRIYYFKVKLTDNFTGKSTEIGKTFFILQKGYIAANLLKYKSSDSQTTMDNYELNEYSSMEEQELNELFEELKYIALKDEKKVFYNLNKDGKCNFLMNFWKRRDPTPNTIINERKRNYNELLAYSDAKFKQTLKSGWKSDRGRVLLVYGKPDQIDISEANIDTKAYQIWYYYNLEGGVEFVFVDSRRIGIFELVHSTKKNEMKDSSWKRRYAH